MENISSVLEPGAVKQFMDIFHENEYRHLIEILPAAIYTCDAQGYIMFYNQAAVDLWGRKPVPGNDLWCGSWRIYKPDGSPLSLDECPMAIALKEGRAVKGEEIVVERPDGVRLNVLPHPQPLFNETGNLIGAVNMLVDITARKEEEEARREIERQSEAMINLERSNTQLEQFAFITSHDLQEPLRKIRIFAERLAAQNADRLDDKSLLYISKISSTSAGMSSFINDILNYSRVEFSSDQFVKTDLNEVFENVTTNLELLIAQKDAVILSENLPVVQAIPMQMNQLFQNLVTNSLKFAGNKTSPTIHITATALSEDEAAQFSLNGGLTYHEIVFSDNGIGFDPAFATKVFDIFERLNHSEFIEGTGIGLALCRKIVNFHGGKIFARSKVNEGASFHIILPGLRK